MLTPKQLATWSPAHVQAVLGSRATAYGQAHGKQKQAILDAARKAQLAKKAAANVSLPHPGYSNSQFNTLVANDPNLVQLRQANAAGAQQRTNTASYYDAYKQAIDAANKQSNAGYGLAVQNNNQQAAGASNLDTAQASDLLKAAQADAASRGQTVSPELAATLAQASASRTGQMNQFGSLIGTLGANQNSYLSTRAANAVGGKTQALLDADRRQQALSRQYGSTKSATALKLSSSLQSAASDAALKAAALGETQARDQTSAANQAANQAGARANRRLAKKKFASAEAKDAYQKAHHLGPYKVSAPKTPKTPKPTSGPGSLAQGQENQIIDKLTTLPGLLGTYLKQVGKPDPKTKQPVTQDQIYAGLEAKGYPLWMIHAAQDIRLKGGLSSANQKVLQAHGVHLGHLPAHIRKAPKPKPPVFGAGTTGPITGGAGANLGSG
jgi:hypothetical protein